tara:strand:+ start:573 stop:1706 length:1134 start_codon:yes stop_codon:yes gene_type:complete
MMSDDLFQPYLDGIEPEQEVQEKDLPIEIENPFDPLKIKVGRKIVPINLILERILHDEIDLSPDFQRRARIWDVRRKSRLIESILLRIPLPVFYVAADSEENWQVVDGLQRLTTIFDYVCGEQKNTFALKGLEYLTPYEGAYFAELPRSIKRRINETELNINVIEYGTPEEVMFNIFSRINTGGMSLNSQEIRNALNPGPIRPFLNSLVASEEFIRATNGSITDDRMAARELALRFCAFYENDFLAYSEGDLDGFLNQAMKRINLGTPAHRKNLKQKFKLAMDRSFRIFGNDTFRKISLESNRRSPVNRALFDAISLNIIGISDERFSRIENDKEKYISRFIDLMKDEEFIRSISLSTASRRMVLTRFQIIEKLLAE